MALFVCYDVYMIRSYKDNDYDQLKQLYEKTEWYGGVFDEARDRRLRLVDKISQDPDAILVFDESSVLKGTISIIEDGRVAMLYRFVANPSDMKTAKALYVAATDVLKRRGHVQILVYSSPDNPELDKRYENLGLTKGGSYACFWANI